LASVAPVGRVIAVRPTSEDFQALPVKVMVSPFTDQRVVAKLV